MKHRAFRRHMPSSLGRPLPICSTAAQCNSTAAHAAFFRIFTTDPENTSFQVKIKSNSQTLEVSVQFQETQPLQVESFKYSYNPCLVLSCRPVFALLYPPIITTSSGSFRSAPVRQQRGKRRRVRWKPVSSFWLGIQNVVLRNASSTMERNRTYIQAAHAGGTGGVESAISAPCGGATRRQRCGEACNKRAEINKKNKKYLVLQ